MSEIENNIRLSYLIFKNSNCFTTPIVFMSCDFVMCFEEFSKKTSYFINSRFCFSLDSFYFPEGNQLKL